MKKIIFVTALGTGLISTSVYAEKSSQHNKPIGVSLGVDLLSGPSLELSYPLNNYLMFRGSLSTGWSFDKNFTNDDSSNNYRFKTSGGVNRLALDLHPFQNGFFVSVGYGLNDLLVKPTATFTAGEAVELGDTTYTAKDDVSLKGQFNWDNSPALSFGWGHSLSKGLGFVTEVGVLFTGGVNTSLVGSGTITDGTNDYDLTADEAGLVDSEEQRLKNDVKGLDVLPIVRFGISYRF